MILDGQRADVEDGPDLEVALAEIDPSEDLLLPGRDCVRLCGLGVVSFRAISQQLRAHACRRNISLKIEGSGTFVAKLSTENDSGSPLRSAQINTSCRIRLCSKPCVQLKKCGRACTLSEASRLSSRDSCSTTSRSSARPS